MAYMKHSFVLLVLLCILRSNASAAEHVPENRVIYEVFVRNFSPEGNFAGVEKELPRLKELGVDVLWLMPVYELGKTDRWGTYASPYAIKNYMALEPDNGDENQLRSLVAAAHALDMEIWFDWVANHTSTDNVWCKEHPEYYGYNFFHPNGWNDVYQLDVNNEAMHEAMIEAMQYWVDEFDIDGYRCDFASGPTEAFWEKATARVLKNGKRIAWLAEDDSRPLLVRNGYFDYNYAWAFNDYLRDDFVRNPALDVLREKCEAFYKDSDYAGRSRMVYLTNHDKVQEVGDETSAFGDLLKPLTVLQFTVYGMPLLYNGQEIAWRSGKVSLAEKATIDWSKSDDSMTNLIRTLCALKHSQPALRTGSQNGTFTVLSTDNPGDVFAYRRTLGEANVVVMLNFSRSARNFTVASELPAGVYRDVFTNNTADFGVTRTFSLPPLGYAVYVIADDSETPPVQVPMLYVQNDSGVYPVNVYAWWPEQPELFGAWPGYPLSGTATVDGINFLTCPLPHSISPYNFIFSNDAIGYKLEKSGMTMTPDKSLFVRITRNTFEVLNIDTSVNPVKPDASAVGYFNMQGMPVEKPAKGNIYIVRRGTETTKELY